MDTSFKLQLEKLYDLATSATATTNFYNQVYTIRYRRFGHQTYLFLFVLWTEEKDYFATPRKTEKIIIQKYCTQFLNNNFVDRFSIRLLTHDTQVSSVTKLVFCFVTSLLTKHSISRPRLRRHSFDYKTGFATSQFDSSITSQTTITQSSALSSYVCGR